MEGAPAVSSQPRGLDESLRRRRESHGNKQLSGLTQVIKFKVQSTYVAGAVLRTLKMLGNASNFWLITTNTVKFFRKTD